jgi:hypothetical protein
LFRGAATRGAASSGALSVEVLKKLVCCKLDLLVPPLPGPVVTSDQPHAVQTAEVAVDKRVARLRLLGRALRKARCQAAYSSHACVFRNAFCSRARGCAF